MASIGFDEGSNGEHFINPHNHAILHVNVSSIYFVDKGNYSLWGYAYRCHLNEDNDGAPNSLGWNNPTNIFAPGPYVQHDLHPLEGLANAASPSGNLFANNNFHWAGLFAMTVAQAQAAGVSVDTRPELRAGDPDPNDGVRDKFPVVQASGQKAPGYYVSTTAQPADPSRHPWEPERYWDAAAVPYAVLSPGWALKRPLAPKLGDFGLAIRNEAYTSCGFFFADVGAGSKVGECSRNVVRTLSSSGYNEDFVTFLVFPGSGSGPPRRGQTEQLINATISAKMRQLNATTNPTDLALYLGGLDADMKRYVDYVNRTERADRPTDIASRKRAEALRQAAEPGKGRMEIELQHWGLYPWGLHEVPQTRGPYRPWPPGRLGPMPPP